jgi:TetR/AcrR family transcriptional regulator, tetracycline repressor protein
MKVNRDIVVRGGLKLLNQVGLERLTLRLLARELDIQAATLYWHFKSKEELIDEMATEVLAEGAKHLVPASKSADADWAAWAETFGIGLRKTLLAFRDGARMVAGTRLTDTRYMQTMERIAQKLIASGFTVREATILLSTIYDFTISVVMEEQSMSPRPGERAPQYDLVKRSAALTAAGLPLLSKAGAVLFGNFDRRYNEGLTLILQGAKPGRTSRTRNR